MEKTISYKNEAVILKSFNAKENDRLYEIFSREQGRIKIIARGARKPKAKLASGLEPITQSEIFLINGRFIDRAAGVIIINQFKEVKSDYQKIRMARIFLNAISKLVVEREADGEIYDDLVFCLEQLDKNEVIFDRVDLGCLGLLWRVIRWNGYQPQLYNCSYCSEKLKINEGYWFTASRGIICKNCGRRITDKKLEVDSDVIKLLRLFLIKNSQFIFKIKASQEVIKKLKQITKLVSENILDKRVDLW